MWSFFQKTGEDRKGCSKGNKKVQTKKTRKGCNKGEKIILYKKSKEIELFCCFNFNNESFEKGQYCKGALCAVCYYICYPGRIKRGNNQLSAVHQDKCVRGADGKHRDCGNYFIPIDDAQLYLWEQKWLEDKPHLPTKCELCLGSFEYTGILWSPEHKKCWLL